MARSKFVYTVSTEMSVFAVCSTRGRAWERAQDRFEQEGVPMIDVTFEAYNSDMGMAVATRRNVVKHLGHEWLAALSGGGIEVEIERFSLNR